ncbi:MAG: hypothetical protein KDC83_09540 [Flavobacteriales bacterium]|nr:hypothetical protein [Flavobacteriales bacterium]
MGSYLSEKLMKYDIKFSSKIAGLLLFFYLLLGQNNGVFSQQSVRDSSIFIPHIDAYYSFGLPSGDLVRRFGYFHNIGLGFYIKDRKSWVYGGETGIQFGDQVKENTISNLVTSGGGVIDVDGNYAAMKLSMRGINVNAKGGRLFNKWGPNPNCGFLFLLGVGYWQHRIRVEDVQQKVPQIEGDYQQGYDRLTKGVIFSQYIGYQLFSNSRLLNLSLGVEFNQSIMRNIRAYNFNEYKKDQSKRNDNYTAFKLYWSIPLYKKVPQDFYYD